MTYNLEHISSGLTTSGVQGFLLGAKESGSAYKCILHTAHRPLHIIQCIRLHCILLHFILYSRSAYYKSASHTMHIVPCKAYYYTAMHVIKCKLLQSMSYRCMPLQCISCSEHHALYFVTLCSSANVPSVQMSYQPSLPVSSCSAVQTSEMYISAV